MKQSDAPVPDQGILVTHLVVAADIATTSHFYSELLGGQIVFESPGAPTYSPRRSLRCSRPPIDNSGYEMRCYIRDPDGRIIEVGQHTGMLEILGID